MGKIIVICFMAFPVYMFAQEPEEEYFARVPTKYTSRSLSSGQFFHISRLKTPLSRWQEHLLEVRSDVAEIQTGRTSSVLFSLGLLGGAAMEKNILYEVRDEKSKERVIYSFVAPSFSAALTQRFFFPYFISFRTGVCYGFDNATYKAKLPIQYSGGDDIETKDANLSYTDRRITGFKPFFGLELHRPFKTGILQTRRLGMSVAAWVFPTEKGSSISLNYGLYWHTK